jgi:DNA-binding GntR family transcriptional regulator
MSGVARPRDNTETRTANELSRGYTLGPVVAKALERQLSEDVGAPVLQIRRKSLGVWQGQQVLCEYVRSAYRGDRYRFYVELEC